jgi:hypothetical protein
MGTLANQRHERFAEALAQGKTATEAYVLAGYEANDGNASRMTGNDRIAARVQEIVGRAAEGAEVCVERILRELAAINNAGWRGANRHTLRTRFGAVAVRRPQRSTVGGLFSRSYRGGLCHWRVAITPWNTFVARNVIIHSPIASLSAEGPFSNFR